MGLVHLSEPTDAETTTGRLPARPLVGAVGLD